MNSFPTDLSSLKSYILSVHLYILGVQKILAIGCTLMHVHAHMHIHTLVLLVVLYGLVYYPS